MTKFSIVPMKAALAVAMLLITGNSLAQDNSVYVPRNSVSRIYNQEGKTYQRNHSYNDANIESVRPESPSATFQLRTNGLYDLALCPNIGLEFQTSLGLAFQLDYIGAWWNSPSRNRFYSNYGFQSEIRYYFKHKEYGSAPFRGLHAGFYGQMATYDFEFGNTGYLCRDLDKSFGLGLSGGYTIRMSRRWSLDLTLGLGYFQSKYKVYEPLSYTDGWVETATKVLRFWGPTKAEVTFVWNLNKDNK